ncbi:NAD(P)-binding protein [Durotheca rogersii]|uniref:NAD(P)-binding protein n=1 Tax=Durotheca rogersii TaxID=419775 RepID=UPI00221EAF31|nr:NAD(P)-binding protein [Durotheca rogersii]KAI5861147.1 NAD(P)-binding protein [Durotheca rogersii]
MSSAGARTVVLITGANGGLGFEIAKGLFLRPHSYHILVGCRGDLRRAIDAISKLRQISPTSSSTAEPLYIDLSSDESIGAAFRHVQEKIGHVDILVNNAGADLDTAVASGHLSRREGWNRTYDTNVTGTHLFTETFAPLLLASRAKSPRLLFLTSGLSSATEHASGTSHKYALAPAGWPKPKTLWFPYRVSKSGMNMLAAEWARLLHNDGIKVFDLSPGFLNTGLGDNRATGEPRDKGVLGAIDPAIGAGFCVEVIEGVRDEQAWPIRVMRKDAVQPW